MWRWGGWENFRTELRTWDGHTCPDELTGAQRAQIGLPTRCAGMQVDMPTATAPLARAARLMEDGPKLRAVIREWAEQDGTASHASRPPRLGQSLKNAQYTKQSRTTTARRRAGAQFLEPHPLSGPTPRGYATEGYRRWVRRTNDRRKGCVCVRRCAGQRGGVGKARDSALRRPPGVRGWGGGSTQPRHM